MTHNFLPFGIATFVCWALALVGYIPSVKRGLRIPLGPVALIAGWLPLTVFLILQWIALGHPPMRGIAQTMLWAAFFLPFVTLGIQWGKGTTRTAVASIFIGLVFIAGALAMKEPPSKELMPALQSPWFAPHVLVYMVSYAAMAAATAASLWFLARALVTKWSPEKELITELQMLVRVAFPLLSAGMLLGAYWAKIAWGHYWGWDPKETAAFVSWAAMLGYIHMDFRTKLSPKGHLILVSLAGILIAGCWFLLNFLPANSIHKYSG